MNAIRTAFQTEIKRLAAELAKLNSLLAQLDDGQSRPSSAVAPSKAVKPSKRLRLKPDTAKDIAEKIVKAVKAHRDGASRANIVQYLDRVGWKVGHHYNEPHLNRLVTTLIGGDSPAIRREGEKGSTRYHAI